MNTHIQTINRGGKSRKECFVGGGVRLKELVSGGPLFETRAVPLITGTSKARATSAKKEKMFKFVKIQLIVDLARLPYTLFMVFSTTNTDYN